MPTNFPARRESEGFRDAPLGLRLTVVLALAISTGVWGVALHTLLKVVGAI
jgi:hypothetical protein